MSEFTDEHLSELRQLLPDAMDTWQVGRGAFETETDSRYIGALLSVVHSALDPKMRAFREMNHVLDTNGGEDTPEYRAAWERWQRLVRGDDA